MVETKAMDRSNVLTFPKPMAAEVFIGNVGFLKLSGSPDYPWIETVCLENVTITRKDGWCSFLYEGKEITLNENTEGFSCSENWVCGVENIYGKICKDRASHRLQSGLLVCAYHHRKAGTTTIVS